MKVFIYWNSHKKTFSIKDLKSNRVIGYTDDLCLKDCVFKVSEAGRQRVLREKRKNVHAGIIGTITKTTVANLEQVYYNPFKASCFYTVKGNIHSAERVWLIGGKVHVENI